ncbi:MAG TPA: hypothetical protein PL105_01060 [Caldilineaceae bacterium]|nr:hypothetical protein [Caldilineaceae bacterium]
MGDTVTMRLVGAALVIRPGGDGAVVRSPAAVVEALLGYEAVHVPARQAFRGRVRRLLAQRALAGQGPDGEGRNWH